MIILGIDPGTATTGYGVVKIKNNIIETLGWGLIETDKDGSPGKRLLDIVENMKKIINEYKPDVMSIEKLFFANNAKTAIRVGQAQGVMIYCGALNKITVEEYAPGTIKKVITGSGKSDKKDIQKSLRMILGNKIKSRAHKKTHFDDAADGLAVAVCHAIKFNILKVNKGGD